MCNEKIGAGYAVSPGENPAPGIAREKEILLEELWGIATTRVSDIVQVKDGQLTVVDTHTLSPRQMAAIAAVEKGTGGLKIKFYDKLKALELLGKYLGLFESGPESQPSPLLECLLAATGEEVDTGDLPEIQQTANGSHDMVEPAPVEKP